MTIDRDSVKEGIVMSLENVALQLERVTKNIERYLPESLISALPEYQLALDAIKKYGRAVRIKIDQYSQSS